MDHFRILKRAFEITWRYRALWLIGLLLVLAGGGVMNGITPAPRGDPNPGGGSGVEGPYNGPGYVPSWPEVRAWVVPILAIVAIVIGVLLLLALAIGVVAVIVRNITQAALIRMVQSYEETGEQIGFRGGWRMGWSRSALRLFLINLVFKVPIALLVLLLIAPAIVVAILSIASRSVPGIVLGIVSGLMVIPIILLGVAIRLVLVPVRELCYRLCAIEGLGVWTAVRSGFRLVRRHLGAVALQWLLLIGLGIAWAIVMIPVNLMLVVLALLVSAVPALLVGGLSALLASWPVGLVLGLLVMVPVFIVVVGAPTLALNTLATVFYSTTWTLTYRELEATAAAEVTPPEQEETEAPQEF